MENEHLGRTEIDAVAVQRALQGDKTALAQIYDTYARPIYHYHYSRVGNAVDAEDLTSQTFIAVIESLPRYQHRGNFPAWIFRIARNKAMDHFRKDHAQDQLHPALADPSHGDTLDVVIKSETNERLRSLLHLLSEEERELIRLRYAAGMSFVEIAETLGRKEDAVRKWLKRLLNRLSSRMEVQND